MNRGLQKGLLIVFEGIDGTGKSTQLQLLNDELSRRGYEVVTTREPTTGKYGKQIRSLYLNRDKLSSEEELELFLQDRRDHVEKLIVPSLQAGRIVLCDRYFLSTVAYQGAIGFPPEEVLAMNDFAPRPDLALLFQIPPELSIKRITETRGDVLNDFEQEESLTKVAEIFDSLELPYIEKIDATGDLNSIHGKVVTLVDKLLQTDQSQ